MIYLLAKQFKELENALIDTDAYDNQRVSDLVGMIEDTIEEMKNYWEEDYE